MSSYLDGFGSGLSLKSMGNRLGLHGVKPLKKSLENQFGLHGLNGLGKAQGTNAGLAAIIAAGYELLPSVTGGSVGAAEGGTGIGGGSSVAMDSGVSTGGAGSVGSTGSAPASTTGGSAASKWASMAQQFGAIQQPQKQKLNQEEPDLRYDPNAYLQYSSKTVKTQADDVPNVDLTNPIDRNGAEILAIQELSKEIEAVSKRVAQLKRAKTRIAT